MMKKISEVITFRGMLSNNIERQLEYTEYDGTSTILTDDSQVIITGEQKFNLNQYLKEHVELGSTVTLRRVVTDNITDMFNPIAISNQWKDDSARHYRTNITGRLTEIDGELAIGKSKLYDIIWSGHLIGWSAQYNYVEIYVSAS